MEQPIPGTEQLRRFLDPALGRLAEPIVVERVGPEAVADRGRALGTLHAARPVRRVHGDGGAALIARLRRNVRTVREAAAVIEHDPEPGVYLSPAAQWLSDNLPLVDEQIGDVADSLPAGWFRDLPVLQAGAAAGTPRVLDIAWAWLPATGGRFEATLLDAFFDGYQASCEPDWGEWWALAPVLRLVLVEQLRRLAERVAADKAARMLAHAVAADGHVGRAPLGRLIEGLTARGAERAFLLQLRASTAELAWRPGDGQAAPSSIEPPGGWQRHLPQPAQAQQSQAAADAALDADVADTVRSLRAVARFDWRAWIARRSALAGTLRTLPAFGAEDEATQDRTLHAIERWARRTGRSETQLAQALVARVAGHRGDPTALEATPGHWLEGQGAATLAADLQLRRAPRVRGLAWRWPAWRLPAYLGAIPAGTVAGTACVAETLVPLAPWWAVAAVAALVVLPASEMVISALHRLLAEWLPPRRLPRLALDDGIPAGHRVLVVVPCLLGRPDTIDALVQQIERHHLASNEAWAQYALLSDHADADTQTLPGDAAQLAHAHAAVQRLNAQHPALPDGAPRFLLLHRQRTWSEAEGRWMGWERKRGKIEQLVGALCGAPPGAFVDLGACSRPVPGTPHLLVLDADTLLPPGTLRELVSIAAHPANAPRVDAARRRVVAGHAVLQPRVALPLPTPGTSTPFHRLTAGFSGLDSYGSAASEVYEDLFGEGSFSGKGLLHVPSAHAVLSGRLPTGQVLSHDLLEGALLRCAAPGDVALLEGAPVHPDVADSRTHRWTRGDWQLLPFIARPRLWSLTPLNVWKMLDNLRRELVVPACVALLLAAAASGVPAMPVTLAIVLGALGAGPLVGALAAFSPADDRLALSPLVRHAAAGLARAAAGVAWQFSLLLHHALLYADAIARALVRQFVTRRHLLAWTTAAQAEAAASRRLAELARRHARTPVVAALLAAGLVALPGPVSVVGVALCAWWALAPVWIWLASRPLAPRVVRVLLPSARDGLFDVARETWRYFERHVGAATHHLPPDNHQRVPQPQTAFATSPTNIGLYLNATLCAWRFGFIGTREALQRTQATLATLAALPRHRGHVPNWIDTRTLAVLPPAYVSTVDSGNLCASLVALAQGLREMARGGPALALQAARERTLARGVALLATARRHGLLTGHDGPLAQPVQVPAEPAAAAALARAATASLATLEPRLTACDEETELDGAPPGAQERAWWALADQWRTLRSLAEDAPGLADLDARALADQAEALAWAMEFGWLYDRERGLLHIGAQIGPEGEERLDANHYDLLASEARVTSLLGIAKGDLPMRHWARLDRAAFAQGRHVGLRSWSGSMFEYLMPTLWVDEPEGSLLHAAVLTALREQRLLGRRWRLPWGVSESAHAERDASLAYQYGPQGAPSLALRRTPPAERVIAPYATLLAAPFAPLAAWLNLRRLAQRGARDRLGFIEALDHTPARQAADAGTQVRRVATFMAHHQGMSIASLANLLLDGALRGWFMSHPRVRAVSPLLHEPVPHGVRPLKPVPLLPAAGSEAGPSPAWPVRELQPGAHAVEPTLLLAPAPHAGRGRYSVMLQPDGSGASRWDGLAVTRWRDDAPCRQHGSWFFVRVGGAAPCSLTQRPAPDPQADYRCEWQPHVARYTARSARWSSQLRVWVSPDDDSERRELSFTLADDAPPSEVELCSCYEVVLAPQAADEAHPAFGNLFVTARWDEAGSALWFERRGRLEGEAAVHAVHALAGVEGDVAAPVLTPVTDRAHAYGRGRSAAAPRRTAQADPADTGTDPVASIGVRFTLLPGQRVVLHFVTAVGRDPAALAQALERHRDRAHVDRAWRMTRTLAAIGLREAGLAALHAPSWSAWQLLTTPLATWVSRPGGAAADVGALATFDRRALWRLSIGGQRPLLLVRVAVADGLPVCVWVARSAILWARAGLGVDIVLLNAEEASYLQPVQQGLQHIVHRHQCAATQPAASACRFVVLRTDELSALEHASLKRLARIELRADGRPAQAVLREWSRGHALELERREVSLASAPAWLDMHETTPRPPAVRFDPATGGAHFEVGPGARPPRPWVNVLANDSFGTQVSEAGGGHTWVHNSRQMQLTPWRNDPLIDPAGETLWLQDLGTREVWNLFPAPHGAAPVPYTVEHGPGFTRVSHRHRGLEVELEIVVDTERPLKQTTVQVRADSGAARGGWRIVASAHWQLGERWSDRAGIASHGQWVTAAGDVTDDEAACRAVALHATQADAGVGFGPVTAFLALVPARPVPRWAIDWTCDRRELHDARGAFVLPDDFGGRSGAGLDPCAALSLPLSWAADGTFVCSVWLGCAEGPAASHQLVLQSLELAAAQRSQQARDIWRERQQTVQVHTPDPGFDVLVNHWLRYQALACRLWARAGFYQAGGAFGFRDQLQDAMALVDVSPALLRDQIVLAASRQFEAGDVQHWRHPPAGAGVRTRFSDDLLWLPAALLRHLQCGGDDALLDEPVPFL